MGLKIYEANRRSQIKEYKNRQKTHPPIHYQAQFMTKFSRAYPALS